MKLIKHEMKGAEMDLRMRNIQRITTEKDIIEDWIKKVTDWQNKKRKMEEIMEERSG